jgi:hypothetical protein
LKNRDTISGILPSGKTLKSCNISLFGGRELGVEVKSYYMQCPPLSLSLVDNPFYQILSKEENFIPPPDGDVAVYIQRWHRQTWSLGPTMEVILKGNMSLREISKRLSRLTGIPIDGLRVLVLQPYSEVKLSDLNLPTPIGTRSWMNPTSDDRALKYMPWFLRDWDLILLQDQFEPLKNLSAYEQQTLREAKASLSSYDYGWTNHSTVYTYADTASTGTATDKKSQRIEQGVKKT